MNKEQLVQLIGRCAREILPGLATHDFVERDRLANLGANSVDRAEILMLVLESLCLQIPRVELFGPETIGELAALLHEKLRTT